MRIQKSREWLSMGCHADDKLKDLLSPYSKVWGFVREEILEPIGDFLFGDLIPEVDQPEFGGTQVNKRSTVANIPVIYGKRRVGGIINFLGVSGDKNQYLFIQQIVCEGEIQIFEDILLDNVSHTDAKYSGFVNVTTHTGTDAQTADADLDAAFPDYTSADKLSGLAYATIKLTFDKDKMSHVPKIEFIIQGKKCLDPRTSTTGYTKNPAVCIYDYLLNSRYGAGYKLTSSKLKTASFNTAATYFETQITKYTGAGVNINICEMHAVVDTGETVLDNIKKMLGSFNSHLIMDGDLYAFFVEKDDTPVMTLDKNNIVNDSCTFAINESSERFNTIKITFQNEEKEYLQDQIVIQDATLLTADQSIESVQEITIEHDTLSYRMTHYANTAIKKSRQGIGVGLTAFEQVFILLPGDIVYVTHETPGWTNKKFRVLVTKELAGGNVALTLVEHEPTVYDRTIPASAPTPPDTYFPDPYSTLPPSALMAQSGDGYLFIAGDGTVVNRIYLTWIPPDDIFVEYYEIRYKKEIDATYLYSTPAIGNDAAEAYIIGVQDGVEYNVGVRAVNSLGIASTWVDILHTVAGKEEPPPDVSTFLMSFQNDGTRQADWTMTPIPDDLAGYVIRYSETLDAIWEELSPIHLGLLTSSPYEFNLLPRGTYRFGIKAVDTTGNGSLNAIYDEITLPDPRVGATLFTGYPRFEGWPGTITDAYIDVSTGGLVGRSSTTWDDLPATWDEITTDWNFDTVDEFIYQYSTIDLGAITTYILLVDTDPGDGSITQIEERHSDDGASYSAWVPITDAITARFQQVRVTVTNVDSPTEGDLPTIADPDLDTGAPPSDNLDLSKWKLTLPTADEVDNTDLNAGFEDSTYFYTDPTTGATVFYCPDDGTPSGSSSFPRCELREMLNDPAGSADPSNNWVSSIASTAAKEAAGGINGTLDVTLSIEAVSENGEDYQIGRVAIGQIHGLDSSEYMLLVYHKRPEYSVGAVYLKHNDVIYPIIGDPDHLNPANGIPLGEKFAYRIKLVGRTVTVNIVRETEDTVTFSDDIFEFLTDDSLCYFKCGQYNQNNSGTDAVEAHFYSIIHLHGASGIPRMDDMSIIIPRSS